MAPNGPFSQSWWWFSIIYSDLFFIFFICLPTLLPVSEWANTIATRDSWSSSLQILISRTKPDLEYLSFSAWCDESSLSGDAIVLWAFSHAAALSGPHKKTKCISGLCISGSQIPTHIPVVGLNHWWTVWDVGAEKKKKGASFMQWGTCAHKDVMHS